MQCEYEELKVAKPRQHSSQLHSGNRKRSPQRRRLLGRDGYQNCSSLKISTGHGALLIDLGRETIARPRPKREQPTKSQRLTRDHHANPLQATATTFSTTVNVPNLSSRPPPAVTSVAKQNSPSGTGTANACNIAELGRPCDEEGCPVCRPRTGKHSVRHRYCPEVMLDSEVHIYWQVQRRLYARKLKLRISSPTSRWQFLRLLYSQSSKAAQLQGARQTERIRLKTSKIRTLVQVENF